MTPDQPLADLALLSRYAALGCAHAGDPTQDLVAVASAVLRLRQALTAPPKEEAVVNTDSAE